jgi:hypothetical protein
MTLDDWTKPDLEAFIITMCVSMGLGFFEVSLSTTLTIGLMLYCGLRYLQGMT